MKIHVPLADYLKTAGTPLRGVFLTHMHADHILGLRDVPACQLPELTVDVRGDQASYARLSADFAEPVPVQLIAWFDGENPTPGKLIAVHADTLIERLQQTFGGFSQFAGFAPALPQQAPTQLFAHSGTQWCRLVVR